MNFGADNIHSLDAV